jgi:hypothetical protein
MANMQDQNSLDRRSPGFEEQDQPSAGSGGGIFEIHVKGHLNSQWSEWLGDMEMKLLDNGEMILLGSIVDQAALMGILNKLNRLNLTLLSVNKVKRSLHHKATQ